MEYKTATKTEAKHILAETKVNHDAQFCRIKGENRLTPTPPPPPPSPKTFERIDDLSMLLVGGLHIRLLFCKIVYRLLFCLDFTSLKEVVEF